MGSIYNTIKNQKKFWLNTKNWLINTHDEPYILLKKTLLESIIQSKNLNDFSFNLIKDIDCLTCLLHVHTIKNSLLVRKIHSSPLLKNKDHILHVLTIGVLDDSICQYLLKKSSILKNNTELCYKLLTSKEDYFYFHFFKHQLKNEKFVFSLFQYKSFNNPFCLISLPYHKKISEILIYRQGFPNQKTQDLSIKFNQSLLEDISFINKSLRKHMGHNLYHYLPQHIKDNDNICLTMLQYHPEYNVIPLKLKTIKIFKKYSKSWLFFTDFVKQISFFGEVFNNDDSLLEAFSCLENIRLSHFSLSINVFSSHCHPLINFIISKSSESKLLKDFLNTEKGKYLLSLSDHSSQNNNLIDHWIHEELFIVLKKIKMYNKLCTLKPLQKQKTIKI